MKNSQIYPIARNNDLVMLEAEDEILVYDLKANNAFCLNQTAAMVWQTCNGKNSIEDIIKHINSKLKTQINEEFVHFALTELRDKNLVEKNSILTGNQFSSLSRREAVRKLSFGTMAALPLISMIAVPTAGQAMSCVEVTDPCTIGGTPCCPGAGNCVAGVGQCCNFSAGFCADNTQCCGTSFCCKPALAPLGQCIPLGNVCP